MEPDPPFYVKWQPTFYVKRQPTFFGDGDKFAYQQHIDQELGISKNVRIKRSGGKYKTESVNYCFLGEPDNYTQAEMHAALLERPEKRAILLARQQAVEARQKGEPS